MDGKDLKPIQYNNRQVKDPIRHPNIIIPIENKAVRMFYKSLKSLIVDLTKEMVEIKKG